MSETPNNVIDMKIEPNPETNSDPNPGTSFRIPEKFTVQMIVEDMAKFAQFLNKYTGAMLTSGILSAANPATVGLIQASATLEQGATGQVQQLRELHAQQLAMQGGGLVSGQGGPGGPGGPGGGFSGPRGPRGVN